MEKYVFIGNRFNVLEKMMKNKCDIVAVFSVKDSFLARELEKRCIVYNKIENKAKLIEDIRKMDYDVLVSNGCPYILPISQLNNGKRRFVNVHPSLLPDLKGKSPINGALLYGRKHGVTCHFMDDGIDTGEIIEQIEIPVDNNINLDLLYHLSFMMEGVVFERALLSDFHPSDLKMNSVSPIYYSRSDNDLMISSDDSIKQMINKVRAFSTFGQYARMWINGQKIDIEHVCELKNSAVNLLYGKEPSCIVLAVYGKKFFLAKVHGTMLQFRTVEEDAVKMSEKMFVGGMT